MKDKQIPNNILTSRDLNHLSDLFQQNYEAYKQISFSMKYIQDFHLIQVYEEAMNMFDDELKIAIRILKNPGGEVDES